MKTKLHFLFISFAAIFLMQGCKKDIHQIIEQNTDNKLLLSKVTGQNDPAAWNNWEYQLDTSGKVWDYLSAYSYGNDCFGWEDYKPVQQINFFKGANFNFVYQHFLPEEVIDNSTPGTDKGYWKFYYNNFGQIVKTGLAYTLASDPVEFEFYSYDRNNNLTSYVYGKYIDTPFYKVTYVYDKQGNLSQWHLLYPNGYSNADIKKGSRIFSSLAGLPETEKALGKPLTAIMKKIAVMKSSQSSKANNYYSPGNSLGDSNVIYQEYLTCYITNDGKINPYRQQGRLLYYITDRNYTIDINSFYRSLQKSNPVKATFILNPDFGTFRPMISDYNYTYNSQGYPVTSHQATSDPDGIWFPLTFTEDRIYQYTVNH